MSSEAVRLELKKYSSAKKAEASSWFFKTGPGQYGQGDKFIGVTVPEQRKIALQFSHLSHPELKNLLKSKIHEERLVGLLILVDQFKKADEKVRKQIYNFYLKNIKSVNNWDLVDLSAPNIIGTYLVDKPKKILYKQAKSKNLWLRRISIVSSLAFIQKGDCRATFEIAKILLTDKEDLIQKAVGWMLREVGKRVSKQDLEKFLKSNYKIMPRTMLRYSIEHFPENTRQEYLKGTI
jgi:3-methyladenine DNA glycosylase AlkD